MNTELLTKLLLVAVLWENRSPDKGMTREDILERVDDWKKTNIPIGVAHLFEIAGMLDSMQA